MKHPWALLACALFLLGCPNAPGAAPAQLVLLVDADPALRSELDRIEVHTGRASAELAVPGGQGDHDWPLSIGIAPGPMPESGVLEIRGYVGARELVRRTAHVTLDPAGRPRALSVFFTSSCREVFKACDEHGLGTCLPCQSTCGSPSVDGSALPELVKGEPVAKAWVMPMCVAERADGDAGDADAGDTMDANMGMDADTPPTDDASTPDASRDAALPDGSMPPPERPTPTRPIAVSRTHLCAIRGSDHGVYCLGSNASGQLGVAAGGEPADWKVPVRVGGGTPLVGAVQVAVGWKYSCALLEDARVYCWGERGDYQTGTRNRGLAHLPYPVVLAEGGTQPNYLPLEDIVQLSAGIRHTCALDKVGRVFCWGSNHYRQLGVGSTAGAISGATQVTIPSGSPVRLLSRGGDTSCVVTDAEELFCWGSNQHGQAGVTPESDGGVPLVFNLVTPTRLLLEEEAQPVLDLWGSVAHMALLAENQSVWTWGSNFFGQLDRSAPPCDDPHLTSYECSGVPGQATSFGGQGLALAVAGSATCVIDTRDRQVRCRGDRIGASLMEVTAITGDSIDQIGCALTESGEVHCWGALEIPGQPDSQGKFGTYPDVALVALPGAE